MIDDYDKTMLLVDKIKEALPIRANVTESLKKQMANESPKVILPDQCTVFDIVYSGDMGGIVCHLKINEGTHEDRILLVSITHLNFNPNVPLARDIDAYKKHRIKKLRKQNGD